MDLSKEREAFQSHIIDSGLVEFAGYGFEVDECGRYLHEPTQVAWDSWEIGLTRAKSQAVPDTHVLVEKEKLYEVIDMIIDAKYKSMNGDEQQTFKDIDDIQSCVESLIESQEPSHD